LLIPYLVEPEYAGSVWANETIAGLRLESSLKKYELIEIPPEEIGSPAFFSCRFPETKTIIVIGTSYSWVPKTLKKLSENGISAILIHFDAPKQVRAKANVLVDYEQATRLLVRYLNACGKTKIALYGMNPNSSTDLKKMHAMKECSDLKEDDIFYNLASLTSCYDSFKEQLKRFDAVICTNDLIAVSLANHLKADGFIVPNDLFITAFGQSLIAARSTPTITTVSLDHEEIGRQAVRLFSWLFQRETLSSVSVRIRAKLTIRESTSYMSPRFSEDLSLSPLESAVNFYSDDEAEELLRLEKLLSKADETDERLMRALLEGAKTEKIEEELFLSDSALRYRIKKLSENAGCATKNEFVTFLTKNASLFLNK